MDRPLSLALLALASATVACSSSSSPADAGGSDAPSRSDTGLHPEAGGHDAGKESGGSDSGGPTTTIAKARQGNVTTAITVDAFVTALAGTPTDYPTWYVEDPAGGPYSGIAVYCDPLGTTVCKVPEPKLNDLIRLTGSISSYMGQLQIVPTAMTVLQSNAKFPPIPTLTATDVAPMGNSPYRGVFVKLGTSKLTVDSVTPSALFDTACGTPPGDAGAEGGVKDAGAEASLPQCSPLCAPPVYSGFRANDGAGDEVYVEAPFYYTDPLQSSPECLTQKGVVAVTVGMTFSEMSGVLDVDPYSAAQYVAPVLPSDYKTP